MQHDQRYYLLSGVGGSLACGLTHFAMNPVDVIKCNMQANPHFFPTAHSVIHKIKVGDAAALGFKPGWRGFAHGWSPNLIGYSAQGFLRFGLYEYFKDTLNSATGNKYKSLVHVGAAGVAEALADFVLCPFEALKVRLQTHPNFSRGLLDGMPKFIQQQGFKGLYAGLVPLWSRQIPYTVVKFASFERITEAVYSFIPTPKQQLPMYTQMGIVFFSGYLAGALCGVVSHPGDTLVSLVNNIKEEMPLSQKLKQIYVGTPDKPGIGFRGLWKGFGPRVFMIGSLAASQWFIYGLFKTSVGFAAPGGGH